MKIRRPKGPKSQLYYRFNYVKRHHVIRGIRRITGERALLGRFPSRKNEVYVKKLLRRKNGNRFVLLNPGPVLTSSDVKNALIQHDTCHRDPGFSALMARLKTKTLALFDADDQYRTLFISGSGTAGLEATLSSLVPEGKKVLVPSNGAFGERLQEILDLHRIPTVSLKYGWGEALDLEAIEKALAETENLWGIAVNHHETSAGVLNPIDAIGKMAKAHDKRLIVDAISSVGAEPLSVVRSDIDACVTSSNKCLHSVTGVAIVCVKETLLRSLEGKRPRCYYLDLYRHYRYLEDLNQTPFTPNITSFFALDAAVSELMVEGIEHRQAVYADRNHLLRTSLAKMGFSFLTDDGRESKTILTVGIPEGIDFQTFYNEVKSFGFLIYDCKEPLKDRYFQIANMGELNDAMLHDFLFVVGRTLRNLRRGTQRESEV